MSERSFRRERERRIAAEERRDARRVRRAAAAAAAAGAFALAAPAVSSAATFTVNSTGDTGATTCDPNDPLATCELRDAITKAGAAGGADDIVFASSISGQTIALGTSGPLYVNDNYPLTIYGGPTPDSIYISGSGNYQVFDIAGTYSGPPNTPGLTMSGLTIQDGSGDGGGGIFVEGSLNPYDTPNVLLTNSTVTGNEGYADQVGPYSFAAGGGITNLGRLRIEDSTISGNYSESPVIPYPSFGGGGIDNLGNLTVTGSTISGNGAEQFGGGIFNGHTNYPTTLKVTDTTISDNYAGFGGGVSGMSFFGGSGYGPVGDFGSAHVSFANSTITGNHAFLDGGGVGLKYLGGSAKWTISHSTISDNETYEGNGGGLAVGYQGGGPFYGLPSGGTLNVVDSTLSGNYSNEYGGGAFVATNAEKYDGTVKFNNSTIASNHAGFYGGGIAAGYSYGYGFAPSVFSTIVADNTGEGLDTPNDLYDEVNQPLQAQPAAAQGGGFDLSFSLVENPDGSDFTETPAGSNIFGLDPQLGPLADNGGPTQTQLPSINSPVVDKGSAPGDLTTDQRGDARTVDTSVANAKDGTDIGSVELPTGPPGPPPPPAAGGTKVGTLKKKHKKRRRVIRTKNKVAKVRITFRSSNTGVTFQCSVDGGGFSPCRSPFVTKLRSAPGKGKNHNIAIKQVDSAGNQVGNVRVFKFRVVLKD